MENLKDILIQILNKAEWTDEEKRWLLRYLQNTDTEELRNLMERQFEEEMNQPSQVNQVVTKKVLKNIRQAVEVIKKTNKASLVRMRIVNTVAASIVGFLILGACLLFRSDTKKELVKTSVNNKPYDQKLSQSSNKTLLTLADGSKIVLDDVQNGPLTQQGSTSVLKNNRKLTYSMMNKEVSQILYNSVVTPPGGQYQVELPDGTQVWLNGTSSIYFQTAFTGKERRVEVTGEAYFEVTKNDAVPFIVNLGGAEVRVLGTHFNVMAYKDEASLKITLLEGKVEFVNDNLISILKPGQQSQLAKNGEVKVINNINVTEVVAWKEGIFDFEGTDIESVTRQLSRWYAVEIVYNKKIEERFHAKFSRNTSLAEVLKALALTGRVRFIIKGKKILVTR